MNAKRDTHVGLGVPAPLEPLRLRGRDGDRVGGKPAQTAASPVPGPFGHLHWGALRFVFTRKTSKIEVDVPSKSLVTAQLEFKVTAATHISLNDT